MEIDKINKIFCSRENNYILSKIAAENDFRLCLNKEIMEEYRSYFAKLIVCSFVVDIDSCELKYIMILNLFWLKN